VASKAKGDKACDHEGTFLLHCLRRGLSPSNFSRIDPADPNEIQGTSLTSSPRQHRHWRRPSEGGSDSGNVSHRRFDEGRCPSV